MTKLRVLTAVLGLVFLLMAPQEAPKLEKTPSEGKARPEDVASADAILKACYDVISGPAGKKRDWDRFRSLFAKDARLEPLGAPDGKFARRVLDVEGYVTRAGPFLEEKGFFEREIARRYECFGHLAHAFSTYESRNAETDDKPFARGINSIQLAFDDHRWWILSIVWDSETESRPIPRDYLPR